MDTLNEQGDGSLPELVTAFQDFSRLSHCGMSTTEAAATVASALINRLILLCQASQGAIFLTERSAEGEPFPSTISAEKTARLFALQGVNDKEMRVLSTALSTEGSSAFSLSLDPFWVHWRFPLTLSFFSNVDENGKKQGQLETSPLLHAVVFLGWNGQDEEQRATMMKKADGVFLLVADAVATVIVRVLSSEQIHDLETQADRKALHEMELLKAELLATVSHELRSPLASVKGYAATLLRHEHRISREERREFLLAINEASDRLAQVINSLLEMSELETGTIEIERTSVNLSHLVQEAVMVAEQRLEASETVGAFTSVIPLHPTFSIYMEDVRGEPLNDELLIDADQGRLREVLDHLLQNAIIHAYEGSSINVIVRPILTKNDLIHSPLYTEQSKMKITPVQQRYQQVVVLAVRDNGKGIPPHHLTRIFDPFYRVDTRLTRETGGMGLGLAICRRIVELHDGLLWVESEMEKGSTFYVCLPLHEQSHRRIPLQ